MGWFSDLFSSPREREAPELEKGQMASWDDIINQVKGLKSVNADVNDLNSMQNKYGVKKRTARNVMNVFNPARAGLATRNAQARSAAAARMGGSNATPEVTFGNIDSGYATAFSDLESNAAQKGLDVERSDEQFAANLLKSILEGNQSFDFSKVGLQSNALQGKGQAISDYLNSLSDASTFDDILSLGGTAAKFINPQKGLKLSLF